MPEMNEGNQKMLRVLSRDGVTLSQAWADWKVRLAGAAALLYSAQSCRVVLAESLDAEPKATDAKPFEARIFNKDCELRWVANGEAFDPASADNKGTARLLTEQEGVTPPEEWEDSDDNNISFCHKEDLNYLLWGTEARKDGGDVCLHDFRIEKGLRIPAALFTDGTSDKSGRAVVRAVEYMGVDDGHGNCAVVAERLVGFGPPAENLEGRVR
ncbi:MAG TPA: CRISPR-associated protein Csx19 [Candidatus Hydrogenedentes bacterium]|nr:CRISPR-associated protein Csx19 [Candidatus Hydrogenedentota bacterium]